MNTMNEFAKAMKNDGMKQELSDDTLETVVGGKSELTHGVVILTGVPGDSTLLSAGDKKSIQSSNIVGYGNNELGENQ